MRNQIIKLARTNSSFRKSLIASLSNNVKTYLNHQEEAIEEILVEGVSSTLESLLLLFDRLFPQVRSLRSPISIK